MTGHRGQWEKGGFVAVGETTAEEGTDGHG